MKHGIEWVLLVTDKFAESIEFYRDNLGFQIEREVSEEEFCQFKLENCFVAIYGRTFAKNLFDEKYLGKAGGAIYSFPESEDIDGEVKALQAKGVQFIKEPNNAALGTTNCLLC